MSGLTPKHSNVTHSTSRPLSLLVVDDEPEVAAFFGRTAERLGFVVTLAHSAREFDRLRRAEPPDVIALDVVLPETDGIELVGRLADEGCRCPIILFSGYPDYLPLAVKLARARHLRLVYDCAKPFDLETIALALNRAREAASSDHE